VGIPPSPIGYGLPSGLELPTMSEGPASVRPERLPVLPLRNAVLFPMSVVPINVGRPRSVRLIEELEAEGGIVAVIAQRDPGVLEPTFDDLYTVGTIAKIVRIVRVNATTYSVVLNGLVRCHVTQALGLEPFLRAEVVRAPDPLDPTPDWIVQAESLKERLRAVLKVSPTLAKDVAGSVENVTDPAQLADLVSAGLPEELAALPVRQRILEAYDVGQRISIAQKILERHLDTVRVKAEVSNMVETEMSKNQRAYVLRQQLRAIREELGESPDDDDEVEHLRERLALCDLPTEARDAARKQLSRMASMQSQSAEYQVARSYVEWIIDLPWRQSTPEHHSVSEVRRCLDQDHYGLEIVKKRIIEFAAIRALRKDNRSPILLFLGPPGVGKTSLGRSIARATGRRYARIALGGVRDEAEIRGHRRTYVGALPGRILHALKKVGANNPVIVLDEIDKMGADLRGDPASALLEALDPAQNDSFIDHYLDLPFDLSKITFLATANSWSKIPEPLFDRLELIEIPGYTPLEKQQIARSFLIPKQVEQHGLSSSSVNFTDDAVVTLIESYTREAGVRGLERQIASVCRDVAVRQAEGRPALPLLDSHVVEDLLGPPEFKPEAAELSHAVGVAAGLGASGAGGELVLVEVSRMLGKGNIRLTGSLGKVLEEAAQTAVSFVRSRSERLQLNPEWLRDIDIHVHVPRARAVRDFAGLGSAIFCALTSLLVDVPCRSDVAVIGELTLRGAILPVSGIKAMLLAAHRAGLKEVLVPARNEPDVAEVPEEVQAHLVIRYVTHVDHVLEHILARVVPPPTQGNSLPLSAE
jgi:ATP-dependent Lon protease